MKRAALHTVRVLALLVLACLLGFAVLVWQVDALGRRDHAEQADVIVVLGARVEPGGRPGSDLTSRTYHAVDLWLAEYAPAIICSGGFQDEPLSAASVCRRFAASLGVPEEQIWLADGTSSTQGDAIETARVMAENGWKSAIVVSHPLHLYRARWLFRRAGVDAVTSPTTTETGLIYWPLRLWYAVREAGAIVVTALTATGLLPQSLVSRLRSWSAVLP
jgi:uncharacterized SAM-binding protein YcdF (DUF218 family)